jgi:hypothetical protein
MFWCSSCATLLDSLCFGALLDQHVTSFYAVLEQCGRMCRVGEQLSCISMHNFAAIT